MKNLILANSTEVSKSKNHIFKNVKRIMLTAMILLMANFCYPGSVITDSTFLHNQILNGVENAPYIFEGEVVATESYYNDDGDYIYTSNTVEVFQTWKMSEGAPFSAGEQVEVITRGGMVGGTALSISHALGFMEGEKGMFMAKPAVYPSNPNSALPADRQLQVFDGLYLEYDYSKHYISARFSEINFECVEMLYETIDSSYVAECLQVYPNGILQTQKYNEFISMSNQKAQGASSGTADITYTIENAATTSSNGTNYFEYDIYVSSSSDVYFANGLVRIQYNTDAFGQNVVSNNKITAQRGTVTASMGDYFPPSPGDVSTDVLAIGVGQDTNAVNSYYLTSTPTQLFHVKMEISDCDELPDLQFVDQTNMHYLSFYTNSPGSSSIINFDNITANDTENQDLCTVSITGMAPLQVNGGTGDIVTITGNLFGSTKGTIMMRNADDGGASWIPLDDYDITQWTDNEIKIRVPSTLPINATNPNQLKVPGSGKIKVITQSGSTEQTDTTLEVYYSWRNDIRVNFKKSKIFLAGVDSVYDENSANQQLGYSFIPNPNIANNSNALGCVRKAIDDWVCATEIRWQLDDTTAVIPESENDTSIIRFGQTGASNVLGETKIWHQACNDPNNKTMAFNPDVDITLSNAPNHNWFYDSTGTQPQPAGKFDFYSVILHELGHGHLLKHVNQTDDLMFWKAKHDPNNTLPWNERMTYFSLANLDGGQAIVNESLSANFSNCDEHDYPMAPLQKENCSVSLYTDKLKEPRETNLTAYPNPFERFAKLEFELARQANVGLKLYSLDGRLVRSKPGQQYPSGNHRIEINGNDLHSGLYIAILAIGSNEYPVKLIKR